jgi:hypothetical protein
LATTGRTKRARTDEPAWCRTRADPAGLRLRVVMGVPAPPYVVGPGNWPSVTLTLTC